VPVDGSAGATAALREVVRIARWFRDAPDIHLLAVYEGESLDVEIAAMLSAEALRRHPQQHFDTSLRTAHEVLSGTEFTAIAHTAVGPPLAWSSIGSRNP